MRCKKVRTLLLTEFIDGESAPDTLINLERHMGECPECTEFHEQVKSSPVVSLKKAVRPEEPETLREQIGDYISQNTREPSGKLFRSPVFPLLVPTGKPVIAFITTMLVLSFIYAGRVRHERREREITVFIEDQIGFLHSPDYHDLAEIDNIGIPFELA